MKTSVLCVLVCLICYAESGRRVLQPLDKNANLEFISMEGGARAGAGPALGKPTVPTPTYTAAKPAANKPVVAVDPTKLQAESMRPSSPVRPAVDPPKTPEPKPQKPAAAPAFNPPPKPVAPAPTTMPVKSPATPPKSLPQPGPGAGAGAATPGPGSVQQLINYYDSRGQASPIRPYSYSQAVKQGRQH